MEQKEYRGAVRIGGKEYPCKVVDGVRYINGLTVNDFFNTLDIDTIINLAKIGEAAIEFEKSEINFHAQQTLECLEQNNKSEMN